MKIKKFSADFLYTFSAQVVLNGIQHLFIFPWLNKISGPEVVGKILASLSIIYIFATTYGSSMNNIRLVEEPKKIGSNGDYHFIIVLGLIIISIISISAKYFGFDPKVNLFWFILLGFVTMIRNFGMVEFRLKLRFEQYFLYYTFVSIGYALGIVLYRRTNNWTHIFLTGEIFAIIMLIYGRFIFSPAPFSNKFLFLIKSVVLLYLSEIMIQLVISGDRLILNYFLGDKAVTIYSSLALPVKIVNMIIIPLGTILITYLSTNKIPITKKWFAKVSIVWSILSVFAIISTIIIAPIYVKVFYPNLYEYTKNLNFIVNLGLGLAIISHLFRIYLIVTSSSSMVFAFEFTFTIIHLSLAIILTKQYGMIGYAWAVILSRSFRTLFGALLSFVFVNKVEQSSIEYISLNESY